MTSRTQQVKIRTSRRKLKYFLLQPSEHRSYYTKYRYIMSIKDIIQLTFLYRRNCGGFERLSHRRNLSSLSLQDLCKLIACDRYCCLNPWQNPYSHSVCAHVRATHILAKKLESLLSDIFEVSRGAWGRVRLNVVSDNKSQANSSEIVIRVAEEVRVHDWIPKHYNVGTDHHNAWKRGCLAASSAIDDPRRIGSILTHTEN